MKIRVPERTITALVLLGIGFPALLLGGIPYLLFMGFMLTAAAWEFAEMFRAAGSRPASWLIVASVAAICVTRYYNLEEASLAVFTFSVLALMAYHLVDFERGAQHAGLDFAIGLGAVAYLGWTGAFLMELRQLELGGWWTMFVLPIVFMTDIGAYMLGAAYGKHLMSPRLSPKKTWEGFAAGVFSAMLAGGFFAFAYTTWGPLQLPVWEGALFGLAVGLLTPLGDLGESMLKRQAGLKDSGNIFPGHGGAFDRIDSWIWGAVLGYYFITWFIR